MIQLNFQDRIFPLQFLYTILQMRVAFFQRGAFCLQIILLQEISVKFLETSQFLTICWCSFGVRDSKEPTILVCNSIALCKDFLSASAAWCALTASKYLVSALAF